MKQFIINDLQIITKFIIDNPSWLSGFVDGEGCFTGSLYVDLRNTWGLQPQAEFNIVQNNIDKTLLEAIKVYFNDKGGVYSRPNDMSVYAVRSLPELKETIIPHFNKYPLISNKGRELVTFSNYVDMLLTKNHLGTTLDNRDQFITITEHLKTLNDKRNNTIKLGRYDCIIDWLKNLNNVPTLEDKLQLKIKLDEL